MNDSAYISFDKPILKQFISTTRQTYLIGTLTIGFFLNFIILLVIAASRQLHNARHLFWAGVSLINKFYLIQCVLELVAIVNQNRVACAMFSLSAGVGYSALLLCLSLAACDRYSAIAHYEWYQRKITNRVIILTLIGSCVLTFLIITSPFWTGFKSIYTCTINLTHMHCVLAWDLLLGIFSVVLHIKIYIVSKATIRQYAPSLNQLPMTQRFNQEINPLGQPFEQLNPENKQIEQKMHQLVNIGILPSNNQEKCFLSFLPQLSGIKRLEIRTALQLSINILPFWFCTFPLTCCSMALYWCIRLQLNTYFIKVFISYLRDLFLVHVVYNPVMYMATNAEFQRAVVHLFQKLKLMIKCFN